MASAHTLLLVEPPSTAREALATLLADEGYEVWVVDTGESAVLEASTRLPKVVIADLDAPGIALAIAHLVALPLPPEVIAVTDFGRIAPALTALRDGASDYIVKPIRADELSYVISPEARALASGAARGSIISNAAVGPRTLATATARLSVMTGDGCIRSSAA